MKDLVKRVLTGFVLGVLFLAVFIYLPPLYFSALLLGILFLIMLFEWRRLFPERGFSFWLLWPLYPVLPFLLLIYMNQHPLYRNLLLELFVLVASFDTGSYVAGTLLGTHYINRAISPKKTWEGVFGGYICAVIALVLLVRYEQGKILSWWTMAGMPFIVCTLSLLGDFFESWLKRRAHIKDSGFMLPGHGGFLDRFDGILFVVFFFFLFKDQLVFLFG